MLRVGITGGIGSGKSTVCAFFELLSIPVFYADDAARGLMDKDPVLVSRIAALFGADIYANGRLDRGALSKAVFGNPEKLAALNALVHPAAIAAAERWIASKQAPYIIKEAAIFFESGSHSSMDFMIGVSAPEALRITRAMKRSNLSYEEVLARISRQMDEDEKMRRCNYVIINDDLQALIPQVLHIDMVLRKESAQH